MTDREMFEAKFPVPEGVKWCPARELYVAENKYDEEHRFLAVQWRVMFKSWQACAASPAPPYQADETPRLVECLKKANENAEQFERQYYLLCDKVEELEARAASPKATSNLHDWLLEGSAGVWESYYKCSKCEKPARLDNDGPSLPFDGCEAASPKVPECQECKDTGMIMLGEEDGIHEVVACIRCEMETDARVSLSPKVRQYCTCSSEITTGWTTDNGIPLCNVCGMVDVSAAFEMAKEPPKVPQGVEELTETLFTTNTQYGEPVKAIRFRSLSGMALVPVSELVRWRNVFASGACPGFSPSAAYIDAMLAATKENGE